MAKYEFIFKNETSDGEEANLPVAGTPTSSDNAQQKHASISKGRQIVGAGLVAWHQVKPWIVKVASHTVNQVELRTGRSEWAQKIQFGYSLVSKGVGLLENIGMGYAAGKVPGAVIGAMTSIASTVVDYIQKQDNINLEKSLENITLQQNRIRAGVGGSRRL